MLVVTHPGRGMKERVVPELVHGDDVQLISGSRRCPRALPEVLMETL